MIEKAEVSGTCHCGAVSWQMSPAPSSATACNCTICRRYAVLWAYGYENQEIRVEGVTQAYVRGPNIEFHFCPTCGCVAYWRAIHESPPGQRRIAVNLRLAEPAEVDHVSIDRFDGLDTFDELPGDGRQLKDFLV